MVCIVVGAGFLQAIGVLMLILRHQIGRWFVDDPQVIQVLQPSALVLLGLCMVLTRWRYLLAKPWACTNCTGCCQGVPDMPVVGVLAVRSLCRHFLKDTQPSGIAAMTKETCKLWKLTGDLIVLCSLWRTRSPSQPCGVYLTGSLAPSRVCSGD